MTKQSPQKTETATAPAAPAAPAQAPANAPATAPSAPGTKAKLTPDQVWQRKARTLAKGFRLLKMRHGLKMPTRGYQAPQASRERLLKSLEANFAEIREAIALSGTVKGSEKAPVEEETF